MSICITTSLEKSNKCLFSLLGVVETLIPVRIQLLLHAMAVIIKVPEIT